MSRSADKKVAKKPCSKDFHRRKSFSFPGLQITVQYKRERINVLVVCPQFFHIHPVARIRVALFNRNLNELGNDLPGSVDTLPLEKFDVEDIPLCGEHIVRREDITDIFFYDEKSNPYSGNRVDMEKLRAYNKYIYPLSLILNRNL